MQKKFKALSDKTRREILKLLRGGSMAAGEIASKFDMSFATVSHHLSILKDADLVSDVKDGKYIIYELNSSVIDELISYIYELKTR
ncbi:MAG: autorepressor SdpR family transcription factor [Christensenellales bacterium]|jgi:ArsR family transcriptional regulator